MSYRSALRALFHLAGSTLLLLLSAASLQAQCTLSTQNPSVTICTPANGATVTSPVHLVAGTTSSLKVTSMLVYDNNVLVYKVFANKLDTSLNLAQGTHTIVVKAWVYTGAHFNGQVTITVGPSSTPAPTITFSASPTTITAGQSSTLTWSSTNAASVNIQPGVGTVAANGSVTVSPSSTTTYTATATGAGGSASASTTVTVSGTPPAPTIQFSASPATITAGQSSTLTWSSTNATSVNIQPGVGTVTANGSVTVSPSSTTTYTATATGAGGNASASTTVTVSGTPPAPTIQFSASPATINSGQSSTLTWSSTNATSVNIQPGVGTVAANGSVTVLPSSTTTYTATATGSGGNASATATVTVSGAPPSPTITFGANPATITAGQSSTLTWSSTNATSVDIEPGVGVVATSGSTTVTPSTTTTYTATATGSGGNASATAKVTVSTTQPSPTAINHVIFLLQENRSFDSYFGMLNPYRKANGWNVGDNGQEFDVDGIDDKLTKFSNQDDEGASFSLFKFTSTCVDDMTSFWLSGYGDVNRYNFAATRPILMDGFVHNAEGYAKSGTGFSDLVGQRAMGYYDQDFLNYYYFMASEFALSDRWFSPVASKTVPNRIATLDGGTTEGLVRDPGNDDGFGQRTSETIFQELQNAGVSWKIYYTVTNGACLANAPDDCNNSDPNPFPATTLSYFTYSSTVLRKNTTGACTAPLVPSSNVGDSTNSFCIDTNHLAPLTQYFTDLQNGNLPAFAYIEAGYGRNDEHPGKAQSVTLGQAEVAKIVNALMNSSSWQDSVFFLGFDEGGGPFDHVPPVPGHTNDNTDASLNVTTDIRSIAVNPDGFNPCPLAAGNLHCDLHSYGSYADPGYNSTDAPAQQGFAAQLGFRVPNIVISPFTRKHYVSHIPMDHTAIIKFVETRFIGSSAQLTNRDAAQPNLLDFFDFNAVPWATPPTPPAPSTASACHSTSL